MNSLMSRIAKRWKKSRDWLQGWYRNAVELPIKVITKTPIQDIAYFQRRIPFIERWEYSQNGEDGIIHAIFAMIGTTNKYYVEFGVEDGMQTNTRFLMKQKGWNGLMMDGSHQDNAMNLQQEFITAENIEELFIKYKVPTEFDLLSIDIDGNDYWVWKAITHYKPRVVIMEYNAHIPANESRTIPYNPEFMWDKTDYYGASLFALKKLGDEKGYTLIGTDRNGVNAFFVLDALVPGHFNPPAWPDTYRGPSFKGKKGQGHPKDTKNREWQTI